MMYLNKKVKFYSNKFKKFISGVVVKENCKTVYIRIKHLKENTLASKLASALSTKYTIIKKKLTQVEVVK